MIGLKYAEHMLAGAQMLLEWALKQITRLRQILLNADKYSRGEEAKMKARDF
jgi:hypothetical protein